MAEHPILSEILTRLPQCTGLEEVQQTHQQVLAMAHQHKIHFPDEFEQFITAYEAYRSNNMTKAIPTFLHCQRICYQQHSAVLSLYCDIHLGTIYTMLGQFQVVTPIDLLMVKFTFYKRSNNLIVHLFAFRKTNGFSY
ncbi:hypothetical protein PDPUS_2_01276 [Photobacterium damselae subsp. piscicida]|uniref:Uncharacterized protein n=1 Tax=Photobacterium damsela subsp. piscicida TaxID=38294 RepID=A0A1V1VCM8_PHODP|nr:hypothetical protein [Photobacterium damselae]MBE8127520.1 hypothetical protein [Photobacterium damselae subsp. piscicida]MDP2531177.1 hypothetical protein [Photobacterium damselae subsp. piscicida]MDP2556535.1 hypothetical protein [Photobacterium damselae subsp. piscicida]QOD54660.1 hypothetical protein IC628_16630 [Photobacterium damselae subsp. piscicida]QOD58016.1 hypothetical protein IC627_19400 [Photobacterium damselae subsp. piscicida]